MLNSDYLKTILQKYRHLLLSYLEVIQVTERFSQEIYMLREFLARYVDVSVVVSLDDTELRNAIAVSYAHFMVQLKAKKDRIEQQVAMPIVHSHDEQALLERHLTTVAHRHEFLVTYSAMIKKEVALLEESTNDINNKKQKEQDTAKRLFSQHEKHCLQLCQTFRQEVRMLYRETDEIALSIQRIRLQILEKIMPKKQKGVRNTLQLQLEEILQAIDSIRLDLKNPLHYIDAAVEALEHQPLEQKQEMDTYNLNLEEREIHSASVTPRPTLTPGSTSDGNGDQE